MEGMGTEELRRALAVGEGEGLRVRRGEGVVGDGGDDSEEIPLAFFDSVKIFAAQVFGPMNIK